MNQLVSHENAEQFLHALFQQAITAALPYGKILQYLPEQPAGRVVVVGAGKAGASMAVALENAMLEKWGTLSNISGCVITRYAHTEPTQMIKVIEAAHPVPDQAGEDAARAMIASVQGLTENDLVISLISGGGSSLLALPVEAISLQDKKIVNRQLLESGATIEEINTVRKRLSAIKGGKLALAAYPAQVLTLIISDVPGDDPSVVASGPTVPDESTIEEAKQIIAHYQLKLPESVNHYLQGLTKANDTPPASDVRFLHNQCHFILTPQDVFDAVIQWASTQGVEVVYWGDTVEGEARDVAKVHASFVRYYAKTTLKPMLLLSGGETTVTVKGKGRGGRNAEFLLALLLALGRETSSIYALACDTDGIDGVEDNAGAIFTPVTLQRAQAQDLLGHAFLANNDAYGFFKMTNQLIITGPTRTNVNDFRAILILPEKGK